MDSRKRSGVAARADDAGFTLIEVIVAVALLAFVMPSVSLFFVSSIKASATFQRRDAATQLADEAMDRVRAVPAVVPGVAVSSLTKGRTQAAVDAQWLDAPSSLATTTKAWDATATTGSVPVVPLEEIRTVGQQSYTVDTFIGTCRQAAADAVCSSATTTGATFHRIVVRVAWSPGPGATCSGGLCEFLLTTVVNQNNEPVFHTSVDLVRPVANPDSVSVVADQSVTVSVLDNDTGTFAVNPVTILGTGPAQGSLTGTTASGTFTYTPASGYSGTDTFRYRLTDSAGLRSDPGTVTVTVTLPPAPVANADSVTVLSGQPVTVSVLPNDTGTLGANPVTIETGPTRGTLTGSPATGTFTYTSQSGYGGADTIRYRLTDRYGQTSGSATVTVTVTSPPPVANADSVSAVRGQATTVSVLGNDSGTLGANPVTIVTGPANGTLSGTPSSGTFTYTSQSGFTGNDTFQYRLTDTTGRTSAPATVTVRVLPPPPTTRTPSPLPCIVRNNPVTGSVRLADFVNGSTTGGSFTVTGPNTAFWRAPSTPTPGAGVVNLSAHTRPGNDSSHTMPFTFTDAFGQPVSGTATFRVRNTC